MTTFDSLAEKALRRLPPTRDELLRVLKGSDDELMELVAAASRVRHHHFGRLVKLNYLVNVKSGLCPEDCSYCSQHVGSRAGIVKYTWLDPDRTRELASHGVAAGAARVCLVASGRGPTDRDVDRLAPTVEGIKRDHPDVEVCACLGLLSEGQADRLREAGVDAYNHNLNTSEERYSDICSTHDFADRVATVRSATHAGLSPCSGLIVGMGESDEDLIDALFALRELEPDSVPVNFLMPFEGTPLEGTWELTPPRCLRILAATRFVFPDVEVRLAGGREMHLRSSQPLGLHIADSIFLGDYLTSEGQAGRDDLAMIADAGLQVRGAGEKAVSPTGHAPPRARRRGAGTDLPPNV